MDLPEPRKGANLWLVDGNHPWYDALTWQDALDPRTIKVYSIDDMIKECVKDVIGKSRAIQFLAIFGHGTAGYQSVGADKEYDETGTISISNNRTGDGSLLAGGSEKKLTKLNGLLADDATVLFAGCNVGQDTRGSKLLRTVSKIIGNRRVQAFEDTVYWWSGMLDGTLKTAKGDADSSTKFTYGL